ncbi:MAG: hypothetical protein AB7I38_18385 [Dehalococcoidia bacterium]
MISRFRRLLARRLRARLICRFALRPHGSPQPALARELVVVLSAAAPHMRRLTVYRRLEADPADPLQAA